MTYWLLMAWGPQVAAIAVAVTVRFVALRAIPFLGRRRAVLAALAGGIPALVLGLLPVAWYWFPATMVLDLGFRAILPLVAGIFSVLILSLPTTSSRTRSAADVTPRTMFSFLRRGWILVLLGLSGVILALSITAGLASRLDDAGHFTRFSVPVGTAGITIATSIYGWFYSIPALLAAGALLVMTGIAWALVPRSRWGDDVTLDTAVRRLRTSNISRITTGALLAHLAVVLQSLAGTVGLRGEAGTTELGRVSIEPPLAALGPMLGWTAALALAAGLALWILVALTAIPGRDRDRQVRKR